MAMDRTPNRSVLFGALIIAALAAATIFIFFIPNVTRSLSRSIELVALMADAGALETGSEVWMSGHRVGSVAKVELLPIGTDSARRVAVTMTIPKKYQPFVQRDSEVRTTTETMIGKPVLDILPGSPGAPPVEDSDTLIVRRSGSIAVLLDKTDALTATAQQFLTDVRTVEARTSNRSEHVARMNRNLQTTMTEFRALTMTMRASPIRILSDPAFKQMLRNLSATSRQMSEALRGAADRARRAQDDAEPSLRSLAARADTIQGIVSELQARVEQSGGGLLIRAQKDSAIVKGLHEAQVQLDSLIAETRRNPLRFWF